MSEKRIGIIMHGVTGRMGMNQHLIRSILAIRQQGGVQLKDGTRLMPDPLLVGRNAAKVEELAKKHGVARWTADLDAALKSKDDAIFFDAASTQLRPKKPSSRSFLSLSRPGSQSLSCTTPCLMRAFFAAA